MWPFKKEIKKEERTKYRIYEHLYGDGSVNFCVYELGADNIIGPVHLNYKLIATRASKEDAIRYLENKIRDDKMKELIESKIIYTK